MIGKNQITIDGSQFVRGASLSDYSNDGGIGSSSVGVNLTNTPGVVYPVASQDAITTSGSAAPSDVMIASCEDSNTTGNYRLFLDKGANFYSYDGTNIVKEYTGSNTYTEGRADMVYSSLGANAAYVSSNGDITKYLPGTSITENWWSSAVSGPSMSNSVPHPLLMYGSLLYVADGNLIHTYNGSTVVSSALVLQGNEIIYSIGIEPGSGLIMIGTQTKGSINIGDAQTARYYVLLWDGFSATIRRRVPVDDLPTCIYNNAGQTVVGYGQSIGIWNGTGITFLRRLVSNPTTKETLIYKHHITNINKTLYYVDGTKAMAYGQIIPGQNAVWCVFDDAASGSSETISLLTNIGGGNLGIAFNSSSTKRLIARQMVTLTNSVGAYGALSLYTNNVNFPRPVFVRRVRLFTTGVPTSGAGNIGTLSVIDENAVLNSTTTLIRVPASGTKYVYDFDFSSLKLQMAQPRITLSPASAVGIVRMVIYYDVVE